MRFLFVGSTGNHAGHSLLCWAIARRLVEKGLRVGFMKPFGVDSASIDGVRAEPDALLFKKVLDLHEPIDRICPYLLSEETWLQKEPDEIIAEINFLSRELSEGKDILLIMGSEKIFFDDISCKVSDIALVNGLEADFVLITRYQEVSRSLYSILSISSLLKERLKGIILNRVPVEKLNEIREQFTPSLTSRGIPVTGVLPEDPALLFRNLGDIKQTLSGEILVGHDDIDRPVSGVTAGSTDLTGELRIFKRAYNKIILLSPSPKEQHQKESARRPIAGIVLTGGQKPAPRLLKTAEDAEIPLMLVKDDTFTVLERLEKSSPPLSHRDEAMARLFTELMDVDGSLDRLVEAVAR